MKEFNLYSYTISRYEAVGRYVPLSGVYHDNGWKVASDKNILVAIKAGYDESLEQRIVRKNKTEVMGTFPNWRKIIPTRSDLSHYNKVKLTKEMLSNIEKWYETIKEGLKADKKRYKVRIGDCYYQAHLFKKLYEAIRYYGISTLWVDPLRAACGKNSECITLLMPVAYSDAEKKWVNEHLNVLNLLNE